MAVTLSQSKAKQMIDNGEAFKLDGTWYVLDKKQNDEEYREATRSEAQALNQAEKDD